MNGSVMNQCRMMSPRFAMVLWTISAGFANGFTDNAQAQFHGCEFAKACSGSKCVGSQLNCLIQVAYLDDGKFGDTIRIVECWDMVKFNLPDAVRIPSAGNLYIVAKSGNTNAVVGGSLPVVIGPAGSTHGGLPGIPNRGIVVFAARPVVVDAAHPDLTYIVQSSDPSPIFDLGHAVYQDLCDVQPLNCFPAEFIDLEAGGATPVIHPELQMNIANPQSARPGGGSSTSVSFTYTVTNPGDMRLSNVSVTDNLCGSVVFIGGDLNLNNRIDTSETWTYLCTREIVGISTSHILASASSLDCPPASQTATVTVIANAVQILPGPLTVGVDPTTLSIINGTLSCPSMTVSPLGNLGGKGTMNSNLNNAGTLRPGNPTGELFLNGNFIQQPSGVLNVQLGATSNGRLTVSGSAIIAGTLKVEIVPGEVPPNNQFVPVLSCEGALSGTFGAAILPFLGIDHAVTLRYEHGMPGGDFGAPSGVVIVIGDPIGMPNFGNPEVIQLSAPPTGITGAGISGQAARDIAFSVNGPPHPTPENPGDVDPGAVLVLLNQGNGTYLPAITIAVGREPSGIVAASLADGAADDDLAVSNRLDNSVTVLFHDSGSLFTPITVPLGPSGVGPSAIAAGNFRGNGLIDLAVANADSNNVTILRNNGDRTFTAQTSIDVGTQPRAIAAAPLSGGKLADLIVANAADNTILILKNTGAGTFVPGQPIPVPPTPVGVDPGDVDNDRDLDLVVSNHSNGTISIILNLGGGNFALAGSLDVNGLPGSLDSWDIDNDGDIDVAVVVSDPGLGSVIKFLRNDSDLNGGTPTYTLFVPTAVAVNPVLVRGIDRNGDKLDDIVAVNAPAPPPFAPPNGTAGSPQDLSPSLSLRNQQKPSHPPCPADIAPASGNHLVDTDDLLALLLAWGPCGQPCPPSCAADIAHFGGGAGQCMVNVDDLLMMISAWGPCS